MKVEELFNKVTRITIVDEKGRSYEKRDIENFEIYLQDDDRTMKIFINPKTNPEE